MALSDDDPRPPYRQIADAIRARIDAGEWEPGARLPSTRDLMEQYGVANQTVQNAFNELRTDGVIETVPGRGSFVRDDDAPISRRIGSPEYIELRTQLEALVDEVSQIEQRMTALEEAAGDPHPTSKRKR